jgi:hypothetical protein
MKKLYQHVEDKSLIIRGILLANGNIEGSVISENNSNYKIGQYSDSWNAYRFHSVTDEVLNIKQKSKVYEIF